jgi:SAM-dependent methyltransferase
MWRRMWRNNPLLKLLLARELGLDRGPPRRVLDIGTAGGHFAFVCRHFGHDVVAIDIENPLLEDIAACLGVQRTIARVEPYRPLPDLGKRFDLITACNTTFNERGDPPVYWTPAEWQFLLNDLITDRLRYPGELYIKLNKEVQRLAYNRDVLAMAGRNGAKVSRRRGVFRMNVAAPRGIRL